MKKIIIFGFPHSGTSILKSIIGHIDGVEEIIDESDSINTTTNKDFILCKYPFALDKFFTDKYKDYIKIFIIRNPKYALSSLNKRFNYRLIKGCCINSYINTAKKFIFYKKNPIKNLYTIKYEDLFKDNFIYFKKILNKIGLKYSNSIFDNSKYKNKIISGINLSKNKPANAEHGPYRTWQINQPFVCKNHYSKIDLTEEQSRIISSNNYILELYNDHN